MALTILAATALIVVIGAVFIVGILFGSERRHVELTELRLETALAKRRMHDLTRQAFVSMAEEAQRRHSPYRPSD